MSKISVLIPAYMERENLPRLTKQLEETLQGKDFEVIVINDGNRDGSVQVIKDLEKQYREVKGLFSNERRGKTRAIKDGFQESRGDVIVVIDSDLQYSPEDIPRLIEALKHTDVVNGLRVNRKDGIIRILESKIYNLLVRFFFGVNFRDCNSGLKIFKRKVVEDIVDKMRDGWHRYLLILAVKKGHSVTEVPIKHYTRTVGRSKFSSSPLKLFGGFYDMLSVKASLMKLERETETITMQKQKVCILTSSFPRYEGDPVSPFLFELCKHLVKIGHEVHVVAPHYPGAQKFEKMKEINVHRFVYFRPKKLQILAYGNRMPYNIAEFKLAKLLIPFYMISLLKETLTVIKEFKIDVFTAYWAIPQGIVGVLAKKITRKPLITRIFPVELALASSKYKFCRPLLRAVIAESDGVVPVSNYTFKRLMELNCNPKKVEVIPEGVDLKKLECKRRESQLLERYDIEKGQKVVLSVGRLVQRKGFEYLIRAMPYLHSIFPSIKLLIVGSGPRERYLKSLKRKMRLEDMVVLTGEIPEKELIALYSRADVFVLPSTVDSKGDTEGLGVVLLEAMAFRKPVVATKVGGIPEVVINRKTGLLVEHKDSMSLAKAIQEVLTNKRLSASLKKNGRTWVKETFDYPIIAQRFHRLINSFSCERRYALSIDSRIE
jgi:glycosyltransferase involved in cell wall biosynthesis